MVAHDLLFIDQQRWELIQVHGSVLIKSVSNPPHRHYSFIVVIHRTWIPGPSKSVYVQIIGRKDFATVRNSLAPA